jgi:hypothetical protein
LVAAILLIAFSLIVPWGDVSSDSDDSGSFYCWGAQTSAMFPDSTQANFYFSIFTDRNSSSFLKSEDRGSYIIPTICSALILPLCLLALVSGYLDFQHIKRNDRRIGFEAGILSVSSIIVFYLFIQFGIFSVKTGISQYYTWGLGFYMLVIAVVLFISSYLLKEKADNLEEIIENLEGEKEKK